jgi:hypothetical protein
MEEAIQEVDSESSQNSVDSLTSGEGNLTMAELASSLMQKRQSEDTETTTNQMSNPYNLQMFFLSLKTWIWIHYPRRSLRNLPSI